MGPVALARRDLGGLYPLEGRQASKIRVLVAEPLRFLLPVRHRGGEVTVAADGVSSALHVVESLGVPRTEIGELRVHDDVIEVLPVPRPQRIDDPRFMLDVHLGTLARRMRLLGLDTAYRNDATDPDLVAHAD